MPLIFAVLQCHAAADQAQVAASTELLIRGGAPIDATITNLTANPQTLLRLGADPCLVTSSDGQVALHRAVVKGSSIEKIKLLIDADPQHRVDLPDANGRTPLMHAAANGHLPLVIALHRLHAQLDATDKHGATALSLAVHLKQLHVATYLLRNGADPNRSDNKGNTVLHYAVQLGMPDAVQLLLKHGADSSSLSSDGISSIYIAAGHGHVSVVKVLREHGVNVTQKTRDGLTVLMLAAQEGQLRAAEYVISEGAAVDATDKYGSVALHYAAKEEKNRVAMIESLIANGADVDAYNSNDESPLLLALYAHNEQNAAVLIRAGTDVTHVDSTGLSTLFAAAQWSLTDTVQLLLEHGAAAVIEAECPP
eukprot:3966-Heterococcus_DN1.PRE.1